MEQMEKVKKQTIEILKSIKSLEEMKERKEELVAAIEELFKTGVQTLEEFIDTAGSLTPEERQNSIVQFQDNRFLFGSVFERGMARLDSLPGVAEYFKTFQAELEQRTNPLMEEFIMMMGKLVTVVVNELSDRLMDKDNNCPL